MLSLDWLKSFVPIGRVRPGSAWIASGAGVLYRHENAIWIVTANHVVRDDPYSLTVLENRKSRRGVVIVELGKIQQRHGLSWVRDSDNDLAIAIIPVHEEVEIKTVQKDLCAPLSELVPSMQSLTVGCPYGLLGFDPGRATPLVLDGIIAGIDTGNGIIHTSAPTFPGNSGGPFLVFRSPFNPSGGATFGRPTVLLAGIVLQTELVSPPSNGPKTPPLHLGLVRSVDAVHRLLDSRAAREQLALASSVGT